MNFIALDVETANPDMASICAVGLVRFENGLPVSDTHFLVDPEDYFDPMNVAIHGITAEKVTGSPKMGELLPVISRALTKNVVIHHHHFDRTAFQRAAIKHSHPPLDCQWLDTVMVARRSWPEFAGSGGYGLRSLARAFGIQFRHHDAREDARASGIIMMRAIADSGIDLDKWTKRVRLPISGIPHSVTYRAGQTKAGIADGPLAGEVLVMTGTLSMLKSEMAILAANAGYAVAPSVTKFTTLLVVGDQDARRVGSSGKSAKHMKAEKMIAEGHPIRIMRESDFLVLLATAAV
ncbi:exonuclease domain-containing protein [Methylobacterium marchantiae]|uniref:Exonuclease domain-containing protein n=1 Tax=Methylobacterium marchantiae TaxID=600331 RepID=A0ABW3X5H5_9HYPH|nr:3'-5' exonuclease DinG [Methylobacterium marchantiae]